MSEPCAITPGNRRRSHIVRAISAEQEGVVARAQLLKSGVSGSAVDRALRSGTLHHLHSGVYSVVAPELLGEDGRLIAALMAAGSRAFLIHGTAAWRWQITPAPATLIELGVPHRRTAPHGVALYRPGVLRPGDITWKGRFRCTSVARTLLDLAVRYEPPALARALAGARRRPRGCSRSRRRGTGR